MKILFTGGGSGGHFFPIISVARAMRALAESEHIVDLNFFLIGNEVIDLQMLKNEDIKFIKISAGKIRRYFSPKYFVDSIKLFLGVIKAFWRVYLLMPDVVFSNGGYASFPGLFAAKWLKIPVVIHSADLVPGIVVKWAGNWASRIAVSFPESIKYFEGKNVEIVGNPIRSQVVGGNEKEAIETFKLEEGIPVLLILGGSQGSEKINDVILSLLNEILSKYQIIHQTGENNYSDIISRTGISLNKNEFKSRYHPKAFLSESDLRNASKVASLVVIRAGAGLIFEVAAWGAPSILIPLKNSAQDHQRENAYAYARSGACEVIEETNLAPHLLFAAISRVLEDKAKIEHMRSAALNFAKPNAADRIASEIIKLGLHD
ncbi:UDP-N-acetylglucosamine--N-acetylmuramyl-(pentapeptide) pyrophosphoryl-undecaprenol N-acetylglucosamine transferase [Candidatus Giovannonibacteria bacterium]|nr:UDP-N-acetylglucosamine--N-acetylmuramyl-(pentapeptide) pyrophosphoryl-undecaprenol N-acetylglucosamine transferase [Candidatus Giovannonibacteria bacterium]